MASYHIRSNSFPSGSHPLTSEVEEQLRRLRSSQAALTSSPSSIAHQINGLQDLYDCADKMLQLPLVQQGHNRKWVDELLNGSLRILDICSIAQNALLQTKESVQELQSVLRRRKGVENELTSEIKKSLTTRKTVKKAIHKALKGIENKCSFVINEKHVNMLKEVEAITFTTFESILSLISGPRIPSNLSGLSLVSKLMRRRRITCEHERDMTEFEKVDATLISQKSRKSDDILELQSQLKELESSVQDLQEGLESLSRRLIKARVSLLTSSTTRLQNFDTFILVNE